MHSGALYRTMRCYTVLDFRQRHHGDGLVSPHGSNPSVAWDSSIGATVGPLPAQALHPARAGAGLTVPVRPTFSPILEQRRCDSP